MPDAGSPDLMIALVELKLRCRASHLDPFGQAENRGPCGRRLPSLAPEAARAFVLGVLQPGDVCLRVAKPAQSGGLDL